MENGSNRLQQHVDAVLEIQKQNESQPLTLEELKEISISLGVTENDWQDLMGKATENMRIAKEHLLHKNYVDAMELSKEAVALNPYIESGNSVLAKAYLMLSMSNGDSYKLQDAERFAQEALKINSKDPIAFEVLGSLRTKNRVTKKSNKSFIKKFIVPIGIIFVVFVLLAGYFSFSNSSDQTKFQLIELEQQVEASAAQVQNVKTRRRSLYGSIVTMSSSLNLDIGGGAELESIKSSLDNGKEAGLSESLSKLIKVQELNENEKFNTIIVQIEGAENRISVETKRYNDLVANYNTLVKTSGDRYPEFVTKEFLK